MAEQLASRTCDSMAATGVALELEASAARMGLALKTTRQSNMGFTTMAAFEPLIVVIVMVVTAFDSTFMAATTTTLEVADSIAAATGHSCAKAAGIQRNLMAADMELAGRRLGLVPIAVALDSYQSALRAFAVLAPGMDSVCRVAVR